jgi:hypothetical protein
MAEVFEGVVVIDEGVNLNADPLSCCLSAFSFF